MSLNLLVTAGQIPEGFCPTGWQATMNEFAKILQVQVPETIGFGTFTFGPTEPSVDKRVYPWFKTNEDGTPDDVYVWVGGEWVGFGFSRPPSQSVWNARLTLTSGDPTPTADASGSILYLTPHNGNVVTLYTGAKWKTVDFSEVSLSASSLLANTNYDVFAELSGSDVDLSFGAAWTDATTRSAALTRQDGVYVLDGAPEKRYVGTVRTTSSAGQLSDTKMKRLVWNMYNRIDSTSEVIPGGTGQHLVPATTEYFFNEPSNYTFEFVVGLTNRVRRYFTIGYYSTGGHGLGAALVLDGTTLAAADAIGYTRSAYVNGQHQVCFDSTISVSAGYHYFSGIWVGESTTVYAYRTTTIAGGITVRETATGVEILA